MMRARLLTISAEEQAMRPSNFLLNAMKPLAVKLSLA